MFDKVNTNLYTVNSGMVQSVDTDVNKIITDLDLGKNYNYNYSITNILFESLLSRYIANMFIDELPEVVKNVQHVIVSISINNKNYKITLGNMSNDGNLDIIYGLMVD